MTKREVLDAMEGVGSARRGQITEQWYTVTGKDGQEKKQGPYFVWTWYDQGKKHTARIPAREIEKARIEIEKGKEVEELMNAFWRNVEATAVGGEKKRRGMSRSRLAQSSAKHSR